MSNLKNRVNWGILIFTITMAFILPLNVNAEQKATGKNATNAQNKACSKALFYYESTKKEINYTNMLTMDNSQSDRVLIKLNAKDGIWIIKYYLVDGEEIDYSNIYPTEANPNPTITPITSFEYVGGNPREIEIMKKEVQQRILVTAELKADVYGKTSDGLNKNGKVLKPNSKTTCQPGVIGITKNSRVSITGTGATLSRTIPKLSKKALYKIDSTTPKGRECLAMQLGYKNADDIGQTGKLPEVSGQDLEEYKNMMDDVFPYCFSDNYYSHFPISARTIKEVRIKSLETFKEYIKFRTNIAEKSTATTEYNADRDKINTQDLDNDGKLDYKKVDYNGEITYDTKNERTDLACGKKQLKEKTVYLYTEEEVTKGDGLCRVKCQELVQVTYDPPVASKAGLCFQYKATIKSRVTCKTTQEQKIKWPTEPDNCEYIPECSDNPSETQAGPNEEFDSCINSCDSGKYTQSCINKCYNKVYSTANKNNSNIVDKTSTTLKNSPVQKLASNDVKDVYLADEQCTSYESIKTNIEHCAQLFSELKSEYPYGYYYKVNSSSYGYKWRYCSSNDAGNCKYDDGYGNNIKFSTNPSVLSYTAPDSIIDAVKRSSPYYFRNKDVARATLESLWAAVNMTCTTDSKTGKETCEGCSSLGKNGTGQCKQYIIDNDGIKRQYTSKFYCKEDCGFNVTSADCIDNDKELRDYYINALQKIQMSLNECNSQVECKGENPEAKFNIKVNHTEYKKYDEKDKAEWNAKNKTSKNKEYFNPSGNIKMFIPLAEDKEIGENANGINGECYGREATPPYWQHYKTTITFPGTWIDLKTGKRYYEKPSETEKKGTREKENYYCIGYDLDSVNEKWWNWKVNGEGNINNIKVEVKDNIKATIKNFGKYNWKINLDCFYAISNKVCVPGEPGCPYSTDPPPNSDDPVCNSENSTELCNVDVRPITQENIFPSEDGTGSRKAGFNWTKQAEDKSIPTTSTYRINPEAYANELQTQVTDAYSGTADYYIHLTKENILELKKYAKDNGYTKFAGTKDNEYKYRPVEPKITDKEGNTVLWYYIGNTDLTGNRKYIDKFERNTNLGKNNNN